jgi:hypothetical protein
MKPRGIMLVTDGRVPVTARADSEPDGSSLTRAPVAAAVGRGFETVRPTVACAFKSSELPGTEYMRRPSSAMALLAPSRAVAASRAEPGAAASLRAGDKPQAAESRRARAGVQVQVGLGQVQVGLGQDST